MNDSQSMEAFLEKCLDFFSSLSQGEREYWSDHPLEFVSSCWQAHKSFSVKQ